MKVNQHLSWEEDVVNVIKSSYMLRSLKYPIQAKKNISRSIDIIKNWSWQCCLSKCSKIPDQKITESPNNFLWICIESLCKRMWVTELGWLPIIERFEFNATKLAFKALYYPEWPDYLPLEFHKSNYRVTLRNSDDQKLPYITDKITFKSDAYRCFNDLPLHLRK